MLTYADLCSQFLTDTDTDLLKYARRQWSQRCLYGRLFPTTTRQLWGAVGGAGGGGLVSVACAVAGMTLLAAHECYTLRFFAVC